MARANGNLLIGNVPPVLFGYGFLYAWGYLVWETPAMTMGTTADAIARMDPAWLVQACVTPVVLCAIAVWGRRRELDGVLFRPTCVTAGVAAAVGTALYAIGEHWSGLRLGLSLAMAGGACMAVGGALLIALWSLVFTRCATDVVENAVPRAFVMSLVCAFFTPLLPLVPAVLVACGLVVACAGALWRAWMQVCEGSFLTVDGGLASPAGRAGRAGKAGGDDGRAPAIARVLAFGVIAWAIASAMPGLVEIPDAMRYAFGFDVISTAGFALAILCAMGIVLFAVRVDFQALGSVALVLLAVSAALYGLGDATASVALDAVGSVCNDATGVCIEIILMLYFVRVAREGAGPRGEGRTSLVSLGAGAGYLGVLVGSVGGVVAGGDAWTAAHVPSMLLLMLAAYAIAMSLVPQRRPAGTGAWGGRPPAIGQAREDVRAHQPDEGDHARRGGIATVADPTGPAEPGPGEPAAQGAAVGIAGDLINVACARIAAEYGLSEREAQVCTLLAHGRSQTYIRDALFLSKNTVSTHARHTYAKLGVHSKQELIDLAERYARQGGPGLL